MFSFDLGDDGAIVCCDGDVFRASAGKDWPKTNLEGCETVSVLCGDGFTGESVAGDGLANGVRLLGGIKREKGSVDLAEDAS